MSASAPSRVEPSAVMRVRPRIRSSTGKSDTPDEEIGEGADHFDVAGFGAKYAYTADGDLSTRPSLGRWMSPPS